MIIEIINEIQVIVAKYEDMDIEILLKIAKLLSAKNRVVLLPPPDTPPSTR